MQLTSLIVAAAAFGAASAVDVIQVMVGMSPNDTTGTFYSPDRVTAPVGSMIQFQFRAGNHTVTQSNFDNPCIPISSVNASIQGIHSGYFDYSMGTPIFTMMVNDTRPMWLYCATGKHCQGGMSMVINENTALNSTRSLETYRQMSVSVAQSELPGGNTAGGATGGTTGTDGNTGTDGANGQNAGAGLKVPATALLAALAGAVYLF